MTKGKKQTNEDILQEARARFKEALDADAENRQEALDDVKFAWDYHGWQWPLEARKARVGRPCLTENRLPQFIRQIVNAQRQNRPSITVAPANDQAAQGVADVMEGMIRHVEQWSKADLAYDDSFESAVTAGIGYFRVTTEYADDNSFNQEICIRPLDNPFSVYDDPRYTFPDGSDRKYCFVTEMVKRDEFEAQYGFEPAGIDEAGIGDDWHLWFAENEVRVAEYWRLRIEESELVDPADPTRKRKVQTKVVEQYLMTGDKIIEETKWLGTMIPIIPVFGEIKSIEGRRFRKSLIRDAKGPQRVNNYFLSAEVESSALQPKAPYVGPTGAFETDREKWNNAHIENYSYLEYDGETPPQRQEPPQFPAGLRETRMGAIDAMKAIMGIYDASLGARANEVSGVAIQERAIQGDNATYHFIDNMVRAIRYAGQVIIDLLPKVYDAPRVARIIKPDGESQMVAINTIFVDPTTYQQSPGINLSAGRYDLVVKAGPSYQTQRQEAAEMIQKLVSAYPPLMQAAGDILVKNLDFPGAQEIAQRLAPPPPPPPGTPPPTPLPVQIEMIKQQAAQQSAQLKAQADANVQQARAQADIAIQQHKIQTDAQLDVAKTQMQLHLDAMRHSMEQQTQIEIAKIKAAAQVQSADIAASKMPAPSMYPQEMAVPQ